MVFKTHSGPPFLFIHFHSNQKAFCIYSRIKDYRIQFFLKMYTNYSCIITVSFSLYKLPSLSPQLTAQCFLWKMSLSTCSTFFFPLFSVQMIDFQSLQNPPPSPPHPPPQESLFEKNLSTSEGEIFREYKLQSPAVLASGYSYNKRNALAMCIGVIFITESMRATVSGMQ